MTRLVFSPRALQDAERLTDFLLESDPAAAGETAALLLNGLSILKQHRLIVRPAERG